MSDTPAFSRDRALLDETFDVLVVGGGITGVCVAREAAGRGLRTLLLEKGDFGEGTSSATTKYIHGGIRYLESREFGVVRESLRERRVLSLAAPHLVAPTRFLMPAWRWSKPGAALIGAGVALYDALSWDKNRGAPPSLHMPHPRWMSRRATLSAAPWLDGRELLGAWAYPDTLNIHPERLLLGLLQTAVDHGAVARNHTRVTAFTTATTTDGRVAVHGVEAVDAIDGHRFAVRAHTVVNAAGPWMDLLLEQIPRDLHLRLNRSKGVHVLTRALPGNDAVFARTRSGRHVIVSPWQGFSFIGPTDTPMTEHPDDVMADRSDVEQLLHTVNDAIDPAATAPLSVDDVVATTVGIRPLVTDGSGSTYGASRRHEIHDHASFGVEGLWSIAGGKWTTSRGLGEEVVDRLLTSTRLAHVAARPFASRRSAVHGAFAWAEDAGPFLDAAARLDDGLPLGPDVRVHLARLYGTDHRAVLALAAGEPSLAQRLSRRSGCLDIGAQVAHAVLREGACTLADIVDRRLVLGTLGPVPPDELDRIAGIAGPLLGWSDARRQELVAAEAERRARVHRRWVG